MSNGIKKKIVFSQFFYLLIGISLFLLPLVHAWTFYPFGIENINTRYAALGGILPWSDALSYYSGANYLLETGFLDSWNMRRPLNAIVFMIRLWLTNNHFEAALAIQALLCGISCLLVAKSIIKTFGKVSGIATLFILFLFSAVFIPTTLSETLGLTLGCLAFVFLWAAIQTRKNVLFFSAALMLMIGLNARAGAFFILPLLIIWLGYHFRNKATQSIHKTFNWKISGVFTLGLLIGLLFNFALIKLYADPTNAEGAMHGNFATTLYGLVSGGKTWYHAYVVFPQQASISEAEFASFLYKQSFEQFKANPVLLLKGLFKGWAGPIESILRFFEFSVFHSTLLKVFIFIIGFFIFIFSIWRFVKLYKFYKIEFELIGTVLLGMFLSAGIIWTDGQFRVFAVTIPFFAAAFGLILGARFSNSVQLKKKSFVDLLTQITGWEIKTAYVLSYTLLITALFGPLFIKPVDMANTVSFSCPKNESALIIKNIAGTPQINLLKNTEKFKKTLSRSPLEAQQSFLKILVPDFPNNREAVGLVYDIQSANTQFVVAPLNAFRNKAKWLGLCTSKISGIESTIIQVKSYGVLSEK